MRAPSRSRQMVWMASRPLIVGSCKSISVTSGACRSNSSTASSPLVAEATTSMSGCLPISRERPSSITR